MPRISFQRNALTESSPHGSSPPLPSPPEAFLPMENVLTDKSPALRIPLRNISPTANIPAKNLLPEDCPLRYKLLLYIFKVF